MICVSGFFTFIFLILSATPCSRTQSKSYLIPSSKRVTATATVAIICPWYKRSSETTFKKGWKVQNDSDNRDTKLTLSESRNQLENGHNCLNKSDILIIAKWCGPLQKPSYIKPSNEFLNFHETILNNFYSSVTIYWANLLQMKPPKYQPKSRVIKKQLFPFSYYAAEASIHNFPIITYSNVPQRGIDLQARNLKQ